MKIYYSYIYILFFSINLCLSYKLNYFNFFINKSKTILLNSNKELEDILHQQGITPNELFNFRDQLFNKNNIDEIQNLKKNTSKKRFTNSKERKLYLESQKQKEVNNEFNLDISNEENKESINFGDSSDLISDILGVD